MDPNIQESKLTAYALGELDAADIPAVEALLAVDADARRWVEDIRKLAEPLASTLQRELADPAAPGLLESQRRVIAERIARRTGRPVPAPIPFPRRWLGPAVVSGALAACLALAAAGIYIHTGSPPPSIATSTNNEKQVAKKGNDNVVENLAREKDTPILNQPLALRDPRNDLSDLTTQKNRSEVDGADIPASPANGSASPAMLDKAGKAGSPPPMAANTPALLPGGGAGNQRLAMNGNLKSEAQSRLHTDPSPTAEEQQFGALPPSPDATQPAFREMKAVATAQSLDRMDQSDNKPEGDALAAVPLADTARAAGQLQAARSDKPALADADTYGQAVDNPFTAVALGKDAQSTFALTADSASYTLIRRFLAAGSLPPPGAVRIEQMVNYFTYTYPPPEAGKPLALDVEVNQAPWSPNHRLVKIALKARELPGPNRPAANIVVFVDVAGTHTAPDKLPLLKQSLTLLADSLRPQDRLAMVVYSGGSGLALDSTPGSSAEKMHDAIDHLAAAEQSNGAGGIDTVYNLAQAHLIKDGVNRVIFATDGDLAAGLPDPASLVWMAREKRKQGLTLSVLSFGQAPVNNAGLQRLADAGGGGYAYIDSLPEAQRVLDQQIGATLATVARDVKVQVEFNPLRVAHYRLIGYENRLLANADFNNQARDAGQIGAGQSVTALYEIIPALPLHGYASDQQAAMNNQLQTQRFQTPPAPTPEAQTGELLYVRVGYKPPETNTLDTLELPVFDSHKDLKQASSDFRFAAAVAQFGMLLRHSPYRGQGDYAAALDLAASGLGPDADHLRKQFVDLVAKAKTLADDANKQP